MDRGIIDKPGRCCWRTALRVKSLSTHGLACDLGRFNPSMLLAPFSSEGERVGLTRSTIQGYSPAIRTPRPHQRAERFYVYLKFPIQPMCRQGSPFRSATHTTTSHLKLCRVPLRAQFLAGDGARRRGLVTALLQRVKKGLAGLKCLKRSVKNTAVRDPILEYACPHRSAGQSLRRQQAPHSGPRSGHT